MTESEFEKISVIEGAPGQMAMGQGRGGRRQSSQSRLNMVLNMLV
jgi:hypothetical protein